MSRATKGFSGDTAAELERALIRALVLPGTRRGAIEVDEAIGNLAPPNTGPGLALVPKMDPVAAGAATTQARAHPGVPR